MDRVASGGRRLVWVGMPPMRDAGAARAMAVVNRIGREEAARRDGVEYVDTWRLLSARGRYADALPDEDGDVEAVRLDDGIHLNAEGSMRLAGAVMARVARLAGLPKT
jgi:hypothetical protein